MIRKRLGRLSIVFTSAALVATLLGTAVVSAATPSGWDVTFVKLPTIVSAGNDAGWLVTVINRGPSNVNDQNIILTSEVAGALPSYLSDLDLSSDGPWSCSDTTGTMVCNVGTLGDDQTVTFTVAFLVPTGTTGSFDLNVGLRAGTGDTESDGPGNHSRGDSKTFKSSTGITSSIHQDAGFVVGDTVDDLIFQTTGSLGRNNKQTTKLEVIDTLIPVTIDDGSPTVLCSDTDPDCETGYIGEWAVLNVNGGTNDEPIKVTLMIWGGSVPGGVGVNDIGLLHADGLGGATSIEVDCDASPPTNADCIESITKVGSNFRIIAWLEFNGAIRGTF